jgi:phosphotransferase system HPr (HPr) family protein
MTGSPFGTRPPQAEGPAAAGVAGACPSLHEGQDAMNGDSFRQTVLVTNPNGFHMRPQKDFVELARRFQASVTVSRDGHTVDGKSIFELMGSMLVPQGSELLVETSGPDASEALAALVELIAKSNTVDDPEPPLPPKG